MATRNIVPRADNEGSLGTATLKWSGARILLAQPDKVQLMDTPTNNIAATNYLFDSGDGILQRKALIDVKNEIGGISIWQPNTYYNVGDLAIINDTLIKNNIAHTSNSLYDLLEEANWVEIGSCIELWQTSISYAVNTIVIEDFKLYICKIAHTSSSGIFGDDMQPGQEKWQSLSGQATVSATWRQANLLNVVAPYTELISISLNADLLSPPILVLRSISVGNPTNTTIEFVEGDYGDFTSNGQPAEFDPELIFDGTMRQQKEYEATFSAPTPLGSNFLSESTIISYKIVEEVIY